MALLIDGYNLLHVTAIVGHGGLRGSREGLLRFLASAIEPGERPQTTIVFDAAEAPPNLPRMIVVDEMTIHFSSEYDNADELIEELIEAHSVPKSLLVVSSDHRIQRAARRRKAPFVDSDVWFADALRRRAAMKAPAPIAAKPAGPLNGPAGFAMNGAGAFIAARRRSASANQTSLSTNGAFRRRAARCRR